MKAKDAKRTDEMLRDAFWSIVKSKTFWAVFGACLFFIAWMADKANFISIVKEIRCS